MNPIRINSSRSPLNHCSSLCVPVALLAILVMLPASAPAQGRFGEIRGVVTETATGVPMPGVTVGLFSIDGRPLNIGSYTGYEGEYLIANVGPGRYQLKAIESGYTTVMVPELLVTVGVTTRQNFQLEPRPASGIIRGSITDAATGEPIAAVNVGVLTTDCTITEQGAFTNADGEYTIINITPDRYMLRATMVGYTHVDVRDLLVTPAQTTRQDIQMMPINMTGRIRGTVTDAESGAPLAAVNVVLFEPDGTATNLGAFTNAEGEYVIINVPPGRYLLRVSSVEYKTVEVPNLLVRSRVTTTQPIRMEKR